jgi:hypothetical protein
MGMFDTIYIYDNRVKCKNGHDLSGHDFQTKDLTNTMAEWFIKGGVLKLDASSWSVSAWAPAPKTGIIYACEICELCEDARLNNGVLEKNSLVDFKISFVDGVVETIERVTDDEW